MDSEQDGRQFVWSVSSCGILHGMKMRCVYMLTSVIVVYLVFFFTISAFTNYNGNVTEEPVLKAVLSECTYKQNINVYMDAFEEVSSQFFGSTYQDYIVKSRRCEPLPGGGHCSFNHNNKSSDAIFYYGGHTNLKFKRLFDDQVVVVYTKESENGPFCHFPPPDKYDIKVSYRLDSTIPVPFFCDGKKAMRLVEMGQPDVPVGQKKLVAGFITACSYKWRNDYLSELMKYVEIDQWGKCLKNTPGDFWKTRYKSIESTKLKFLEENPYKFLIAFEGSVQVDYVTEKIYHAYMSRTIPIYYGHKAVFDLVPSNSSLIFANKYSPKELAELIHRIANNDTLYRQYFVNWDLSKLRKLHEKYCLEHFTCVTCRKVWDILYERKCKLKSVEHLV